jgi:CRP/FNR family cyclic AMP-dependent transcriptional regulator
MSGGVAVNGEFLARIPIFGGLPPDALERIIEAGSMVEAAAGTQLIAEGEQAKRVFVVWEGELEIMKRGTGGDIRLAVLRPGDCVGEMSLIDIQPRSATVRTLIDSRLFRLDHTEIARLYRSHSDVYLMLVMNIAREISRRLRRADQVLANMGIGSQDMWSTDAASLR